MENPQMVPANPSIVSTVPRPVEMQAGKDDGFGNLEWHKDMEKSLEEYFRSQINIKTDMELLSVNWSNQKMDFIERFRAVIMNGLKGVEKCFKWCEGVWKNTKFSLEEIVSKDEAISKHFDTKFVAEFTEEGKAKGKERDFHIGDKHNMVENYMIEVLEILDQHKHNHMKTMQQNNLEMKNKILKPINTHYLDFQGAFYTKFKKIKSHADKLNGNLLVAMSAQGAALTKLRGLLKVNIEANRNGQQPKKDTAKCLIRLYVRVQHCFTIFHALVETLMEAWKLYSDASIDMNANIHKDLIEFYELMRQYAFPSHAGMSSNIFDLIIFKEDDVCTHLDSIFTQVDVEHIRKFTEKEGRDGLLQAAHSEKLHFIDSFAKYLGAHWIDKKDKVEQYFFVNMTPDLFCNVFQCTEFHREQMPTNKAIISDSIKNIKTKAVEWKKEFHLKGNQPGSWFSDGKVSFCMNNESEVKHLSDLIESGKKRLQTVARK